MGDRVFKIFGLFFLIVSCKATFPRKSDNSSLPVCSEKQAVEIADESVFSEPEINAPGLKRDSVTLSKDSSRYIIYYSPSGIIWGGDVEVRVKREGCRIVSFARFE